MELLLIYRPRRDGRLSWPSWLTHSGRLTHEVVTRQPWIRRRSGKVRQLRTDVLTTEPRRQRCGDMQGGVGQCVGQCHETFDRRQQFSFQLCQTTHAQIGAD